VQIQFQTPAGYFLRFTIVAFGDHSPIFYSGSEIGSSVGVHFGVLTEVSKFAGIIMHGTLTTKNKEFK